MRISSISAAMMPRGARPTSSRPLSSICQARARAGHGEPVGQGLGPCPLAGAQRGNGVFAGGFDARRGVHGFGEVADDLNGIGAVGMQGFKLLDGFLRLAADNRVHQIIKPRAIG